jgi:hypothetical protein
MTTKKTYDPKKTLEKFGIAFLEVLIAGAIVYCTDRVEFLMLVPVLEALRNWLKNRNK